MGASAEVVGRLKGGRELVRFACAIDPTETPDVDVANPSAPAEQWIHILPQGPHVEARDGRKFTVEDADKVVAATELPMLVDWEHASESGDTRAAGWIEELSVRDSGVWGRVRWTPQGREHVKTQHYRFLSPVVLGRRAHSADRKQLAVEQLASVALTNRPALRMHGIEAFRAQLSQRFGALEDERIEGDMGNLSKLVREACGLGEDASEDALVAALDGKLKAQTAGSDTTLREALSTVTSERNALTVQVGKLEQELASFKGQAFAREVEVFFDKGSRAGKIAPAARKKWIAFAQKSRDNFETFRDVIYPDLPVLVPPTGKGQKTPKPGKERASLSAVRATGVDVEALRRLGFTDEQILESVSEVDGGTTPAPGGAPAPKPVEPDEDDDEGDEDDDEGDEDDEDDDGDTTDETEGAPAPQGG